MLSVLVSCNRVVLARWRVWRRSCKWRHSARAARIAINEGGEDCLVSFLSVKRYTDVLTICPSRPNDLRFTAVMSAESNPSQDLATSPEVPDGPSPLAGTKRSRRGTTPISTAGRKSKRLERVPISVPSVTDPMEGSSRSVTSGAAAPVVPSSSATVDAVREAMLQVLADPQLRSLMQHSSAATSPPPSMGVSDSSADIIPAALTEATTTSSVVSESQGTCLQHSVLCTFS